MVAGLRNMRRTGRKIRLLAVDGDLRGFPVGAVVKNPPAKAGGARDSSSIHGLGKYLRVGSGKPLQYSCLENFMGRGAWWATVHGATKSQIQLSD